MPYNREVPREKCKDAGQKCLTAFGWRRCILGRRTSAEQPFHSRGINFPSSQEGLSPDPDSPRRLEAEGPRPLRWIQNEAGEGGLPIPRHPRHLLVEPLARDAELARGGGPAAGVLVQRAPGRMGTILREGSPSGLSALVVLAAELGEAVTDLFEHRAVARASVAV